LSLAEHANRSYRKESKMYFVYALTEPDTGTVAYIGMTNDTKRRLQQHLSCNGTNVAKNTWIQELLERGAKPSLNVLETVNTRAMAQKREKYWMRYYTEKQVCLHNIRINGNSSSVQNNNDEIAALLIEEKFCQYFIYELVDPQTDVPRYVGMTKNPRKRYSGHMNGKTDGGEKYEWIRHLQEKQIQPKMRILETVSDLEHAKEREKYWIQYYVNSGIKLVNIQLNETAIKSPKEIKERKVVLIELTEEERKIYYTESEVREILNIDHNMLSFFIKKRAIKHKKMGYYLKSDIDKFNVDLNAFCDEYGAETLFEFYSQIKDTKS